MDNTEEFVALELSQKEDTVEESQPVEVEKPTSIRDSLEQNLKASPDQLKAKVAIATDELRPDNQAHQQQANPIAAPADMNKAEREAFMNPSPQNAHILQGYLSRRGYEIRSELARQSQANQDRLSIADEVYQTFEPYAADYQDIRPTEILSNAIAWDQKFSSDPIEAAWEFLDSYGIHPEELLGYEYQPQQEPYPEYLTREEADALAEEKFNTFMARKDQETLVSQRYDALDSFKKSRPLFRDTGTADQLEAAMAPLVKAEIDANPQRNVQEILSTVYDYVTTTNPVFSEIVNRLNAKPMIDKKTAATQKAKAASRSITGSPGSGSPKIHTSLRENLRLRLNGAI
jgi:hypothetical protein